MTIITIKEKIITPNDVNAERDRRLALPFEFNGQLFDRDEKSLSRITGAAALAGFAVVNQTQRSFDWITHNNQLVTFSAEEMLQFGEAAAAVEASIIFAARLLKDMPIIPLDYTSDIYWP